MSWLSDEINVKQWFYANLMGLLVRLGIVRVVKKEPQEVKSGPICPDCGNLCERVWVDTDVHGIKEYAMGAWLCKCKRPNSPLYRRQ